MRRPARSRELGGKVIGKRFAATVGLLAAGFSASAYAEDQKPAAPTAPAAVAPTLSLGASKPLTADALGEQRAKAKLEIDKITVNAPAQNGTVIGNTAIGNVTGANAIAGSAFSSAAGMITAIQNTGNNVLIQNSTIVNVSVAP
jgi:hypothetical protein